MFVSEISLWGAALVACVVFVAMIALAYFDRSARRFAAGSSLLCGQHIGGCDSIADATQKNVQK